MAQLHRGVLLRTAAVLAIAAATNAQLQAAEANYIISEVFNGGPNGLQYVEIYNPTEEPADLA